MAFESIVRPFTSVIGLNHPSDGTHLRMERVGHGVFRLDVSEQLTKRTKSVAFHLTPEQARALAEFILAPTGADMIGEVEPTAK